MKTVLIYSGGLDSTVLLYKLLNEGKEVLSVSFDYGQRHKVELESAKFVCRDLGLPHKTISLTGCSEIFAGSSQTSSHIPVPEGHYESESMKLTVVPNRNMVMISLATAYAISQGAEEVAYGAHSGDHAIYPDCRADFIQSMRGAMSHCDWRQIDLYSPFVYLTKAQIVSLGHSLQVPFERTYSCYKGQYGHTGGQYGYHCGKCGTCVERREAFVLAGVVDPTTYDHAFAQA